MFEHSHNFLRTSLRENQASHELRSLLYHIARAVKYINFSLRSGNTGSLNVLNPQGEVQVELDVIADTIIMQELARSHLVRQVISEEQDVPKNFNKTRANFIVAYDPLDGSSLVDANFSIGSIFGIWEGGGLVGKTGHEQICSCYTVYGPRIILVIAMKGSGVMEFELDDVGEFVKVDRRIVISKKSKHIAPGNLRAAKYNPKYFKLLQQWINEGKTMRYSGGMVPDIHHIISKGEGIFTYPSDEKHTQGKHRLTFEAMPFALIMKESGGILLDEYGEDILMKKVTKIHERTTIFAGSIEEVQRSICVLKS